MTRRQTSAVIYDHVGARGRRVWQGIEADDPPTARYHWPELLETAEGMLAARRKRFPMMIQRREIDAVAAEAELAAFEAIVADMRWLATGEGAPASILTLHARRAALDTSLATIADIARDQGGFPAALAAQAECVIAMRWHLEPGSRSHANRALSFSPVARSSSSSTTAKEAENAHSPAHAQNAAQD